MKVLMLITALYLSHVVISKPVDISDHKNASTATRGERLILPCSVGQPAACQWTKDGFGLGTATDLPGWPRYSLVGSQQHPCDLLIDPVLPVDEGRYKCQGGGVTGGDVMVTVVAEPGPPNIKQALHGDVMEVVEDEEVVLDCESQGARPAAEIEWNYKNLKDIEVRKTKKVLRIEDLQRYLGPEQRTHSKNPYQLVRADKKTFKTISTLRFIAKEDTAISCSAFNEGFTSPRMSGVLHVKVKYKPKLEMKFLGEEKLREGDNLEVECSDKAYPPNVTYKWFVDNVEHKQRKQNIFKIKKITRKHNKLRISCLVENSVGKTQVETTLNVEFPPEIIIQPLTKTVRLGDQVTFRCKADANPEPTYIWVRGSSPSSAEVIATGQNLSIFASDQTENKYICQVVSEGFPIVSSSPGQLIIEREQKNRVEHHLKELPIMDGVVPVKHRDSGDHFTKVITNFKRDYLLFQKRTQQMLKQSKKYISYSNKFNGRYKRFKKNIKKFPKSFKKFLMVDNKL